MGVVHRNQEGLALVHALKPPGHSAQGPDAFGDFFTRYPQAHRRRAGRENVVEVRPPEQWRGHFDRACGRDELGLKPF